MSRLLIVAHAPLASALRSVAAHAFPEGAGWVHAVDIAADEADPEAAVRRALDALAGHDVLLLTDAFGATPCTASQRAAAGMARARVVAGVNVPMLWRTLGNPDLPLDELAQRAVAGAVQGVIQANPTPRQNQPGARPGHEQVEHHDQQ
ncbi:MAG: PTS fructose transporter subunit IIA [Rubrivivax sp.]|jgi:PTS system mannose-specific IIA component|nr:PTS fructose transporter subunit IIA [Rubrivivax sp.]MCL4700051.1 PTS fructose transporter subunit IIA [Burkholderiaceae bacterium]